MTDEYKTALHKLMNPQTRKEYHEAFIVIYSEKKGRDKLVELFGEKYFNKVMEIYQERLDKDNFMIGPQSEQEWKELQKKYPKD